MVPIFCAVALRVGFVDTPGGRKQHEEAVPPIGGLVLFPVFIVIGYLSGMKLETNWALFTGLIILLVVGAFDDRRHVNPWIKFAAQFLAAGIIVGFGGARLGNLGNLFGYGLFGIDAIAFPFCVIATVLLINAINLMDGLDGLAGGKTAVILGWFAVAAAMAGDLQYLLGLCTALGALGGFLFYNMRHPFQARANIFLGDAGSMCLGLLVAWFALKMGAGKQPALVPISVAWIIGLPIFDACGQFYRRVREGRHPFSPDRGHFHHHFIQAGFSVGRTSVLIMAIGFFMGAFGYIGLLVGVPQVILTIAWIALLFIHMALSYRKERYVKLLAYVFGKDRLALTKVSGRKLAFLTFVFVCLGFMSACVSSESDQSGMTLFTEIPVVESPPPAKRVPSEALLNAEGNWHMVETEPSFDPEQAHKAAREKVNTARRDKLATLSPGFSPDAPSGGDGTFRVLLMEPQGVKPGKGLKEYAEMGGDVTERAVVTPGHKVVGTDLLGAFKSLFNSDKGEEEESVNVVSAQSGASSKDSSELASNVYAEAALKSKPLPAGKPQAVSKEKKVSGKGNFFSSLFSSDDKKQAEEKSVSAVPVPVKPPVYKNVSGRGSANVTALRSGEHKGRTRLVLDVTAAVPFTARIEQIRNVLRVDMLNTGWEVSDSSRLGQGSLLGSYVARPSQDGKGTVLEVRLKKKSAIMRVMSLKQNIGNGSRIVIDLEN
ncbi:MAG: undecaprenyl/decaprenyl-phosphate alpha-N-acetylglucosaminyl 1-phosphate transferase [Alphaproteobacteria bacterium]|nr:undecaprenyl/decaprenyl-phosphate alpha-N-acetylglucosaminyl 1-phosphate transferase [Alphaproteobacteria bacterium]